MGTRSSIDVYCTHFLRNLDISWSLAHTMSDNNVAIGTVRCVSFNRVVELWLKIMRIVWSSHRTFIYPCIARMCHHWKTTHSLIHWTTLCHRRNTLHAVLLDWRAVTAWYRKLCGTPGADSIAPSCALLYCCPVWSSYSHLRHSSMLHVPDFRLPVTHCSHVANSSCQYSFTCCMPKTGN